VKCISLGYRRVECRYKGYRVGWF